MADSQLLTDVRALVGREYGRVYAWDEVNAPMIRQWCEIMGVDNPLYSDPVVAAEGRQCAALRNAGRSPPPCNNKLQPLA